MASYFQTFHDAQLGEGSLPLKGTGLRLYVRRGVLPQTAVLALTAPVSGYMFDKGIFPPRPVLTSTAPVSGYMFDTGIFPPPPVLTPNGTSLRLHV
jgi:hypothetical protein